MFPSWRKPLCLCALLSQPRGDVWEESLRGAVGAHGHGNQTTYKRVSQLHSIKPSVISCHGRSVNWICMLSLRKLPFETIITLYRVKLDFKDLCTLSALFRFRSHTDAQTSSDFFVCHLNEGGIMWLCCLPYGKSVTSFPQVHIISLFTDSSTFCCDISAPLLHAWLKF